MALMPVASTTTGVAADPNGLGRASLGRVVDPSQLRLRAYVVVRIASGFAPPPNSGRTNAMVVTASAPQSKSVQPIVIVLTYTLAFLALDYVSYLKPYGTFGVTPWNPQSGLSVAMIYLAGAAYGPAVLASAAVADYVLRGGPLAWFLEVATSITLGAVYIAAGTCLRGIKDFDPRLPSSRDVMILIAVAGVASVVSAILYTAVISLGGELGRGEFSRVSWRGFVGDFIGILVVAPVIFLMFMLRPWPRVNRDWVSQLASIVVVLFVIFGYQEATAFQLFYLMFLPLLWVAMRYGTAGAAVALAFIQVGLVIGSEVRFGNDPGLAAMQTLMIALAVTGLLVGAIVDEREAASARIRDQQAALNSALRVRAAGEIAAAIGHEINQPLTAIKTYASVASNAVHAGNEPLAREALDKLTVQSDRAARVIKSIRDLLRQGSCEPAPLDINAMMKEFIDLFGSDLAAKGVSLTASIPDDLPIVMADKTQLTQALHNLVTNSCDAILGVKDYGHISIVVTCPNNEAFAIAVLDDGPGFPPGFNTLEPNLFVTTKPEGSGIGLSIARTIAETHGGRLEIETSMRGACVRMILPKARPTDEPYSFDH